MATHADSSRTTKKPKHLDYHTATVAHYRTHVVTLVWMKSVSMIGAEKTGGDGRGSHDKSDKSSQSTLQEDSQRISHVVKETESQKAFELHEEIVKAMLEKSVDPFERSYRLGDDPVILDATMKAPHLLQGTISLKYWREFSSNRKYLETRSAEKSHPAIPSSHIKKKKKEAQLKARGRSQKKLQDVRQPSAQITCSFAAPPTGFPLFDSHIIGPKNPVQKLLEDRNLRKSADSNEGADPIPSPPSPAARTSSAKRLLKPLVVVSGDVGTPLPGGVISQGRAREAQQISITAGIPFPSGRELDGVKKNALGGPFPSSMRFPSAASLSKSVTAQPSATPQKTLRQSDKYRGRFSSNPRFQQSHLESNSPDPGCYQVCPSISPPPHRNSSVQVPRLFDDIKPKLTSERAEEMIQQIHSQNEKAIR
jgi:hypothetical protein